MSSHAAVYNENAHVVLVDRWGITMNNDHVHSATAKLKNRQYQFCFIFRETAK